MPPMLLLTLVLGCSRPDTATRWVHVTPWDPVSEELLACELPDALPIRWVTREAGAVMDAVLLDAPEVPDFADSLVGRVTTDDGRTWVVRDCDALRNVASSSPPPPQGAATLELLALDFDDTPVDVLEATSLRTDELDDPELLGEFAFELARAPETAPVATRLARHALVLEGGADAPDPLVLAALESVLAAALWTEGTKQAREEAVERQYAVATARQTPHTWQTLHRYEEELGRPKTPIPGPRFRQGATADGMAREVTQISATLRVQLGRWNPTLEAALLEAEGHIAAGPGDGAAACERVQDALRSLYDGHFMSFCPGQDDWVRAAPVLRARPDPGPAQTPLPEPLSIRGGFRYEVPLLGVDGRATEGSVVFEAPPPEAVPPTERPPGWSMERRDDDLPSTAVVTVTTMMQHELYAAEGHDRGAFLDSAREASGHDVVVLDLRGNMGGAYAPAYKWLEAFSDTHHTLPGSMANRRGGWRVRDHGRLEGKGAPLSARVYILVDGDTASAGEAFAVLARQLPGAHIVGTPTRGALLANGATSKLVLPQLQMHLLFGDTAYVWEQLHPVADGVGMLPDLWYLDDGDVVQAVRRHAAGG